MQAYTHNKEKKENFMTRFQLEQLIRIYNTLTTISTKGEDTLTMADCLNVFRPLLLELQEEMKNDIKE